MNFATANLTAKPTITSTSQRIKAIQNNSGGVVFSLSEMACTTPETPLLGNTRSHPESTNYTCSTMNQFDFVNTVLMRFFLDNQHYGKEMGPE
jgi:hypothetical protein